MVASAASDAIALRFIGGVFGFDSRKEVLCAIGFPLWASFLIPDNGATTANAWV